MIAWIVTIDGPPEGVLHGQAVDEVDGGPRPGVVITVHLTSHEERPTVVLLSRTHQ